MAISGIRGITLPACFCVRVCFHLRCSSLGVLQQQMRIHVARWSHSGFASGFHHCCSPHVHPVHMLKVHRPLSAMLEVACGAGLPLSATLRSTPLPRHTCTPSTASPHSQAARRMRLTAAAGCPANNPLQLEALKRQDPSEARLCRSHSCVGRAAAIEPAAAPIRCSCATETVPSSAAQPVTPFGASCHTSQLILGWSPGPRSMCVCV